MGRRLPAKVHLLRGNPSHLTRAELDRGARFPPGVPPEPEWSETFPLVCNDARLTAQSRRCRLVASRVWRLVVPELDGMGLLSTVDGGALLDLATCAARIDQCERQLSAEGPVDALGRRHPASILVRGYRSHLSWLEVQFGLSPKAREALHGASDVVPDAGDGTFDV